MSTYKITYKKSTSAIGLPETLEAAGYRTAGRFFEFYSTEDSFTSVVVASISSDLVALVSLQEEK